MTRTRIYVNITGEEITALDKLTETLGYPSRIELVTTIIQAAVYGSRPAELPRELTAISDAWQRLEVLRTIFFEILDEYAFPAIAIKGPDKVSSQLIEDLRTWMYERCRTIPLDRDMEKWTRLYYTINRGRIIDYQINLMTREYQEEHTVCTAGMEA